MNNQTGKSSQGSKSGQQSSQKPGMQQQGINPARGSEKTNVDRTGKQETRDSWAK